MNKILLSLIVLGLSINSVSAVIYQGPTVGNSNFYPIMQHQVEKQETLDFVNHPEQYKENRAKKDAQLDFLEGKTNANQYFQINGLKDHSKLKYNTNIPTNMNFSTDSNGQIIIKGN